MALHSLNATIEQHRAQFDQGNADAGCDDDNVHYTQI